MKITDFIKGMALSLAAAYLFQVLLGVSDPHTWRRASFETFVDSFIAFPIFILSLTFWFILPVGGLLGAAIPHLARRHPPKVAICLGLAAGMLIGIAGSVMASYQIARMETPFGREVDTSAWWPSFWRHMIFLGTRMCFYSMAWIGVCAYICTKRPRHRLVTPEAS